MDIDALKTQIDALKKKTRTRSKAKTIEKEYEKMEEESIKEDVAPTPQPENRSAFNCAPCRGEGITFPRHSPEGVICPVCQGTGKH